MPVPQSGSGPQQHETVLVTGATGAVGRRLVELLVGGGRRVRAVSRHPERAALPPEVQRVAGDMGHPEELAGLLAGCRQAFLLLGPDDGAHFAPAAVAAGVEHVVLLSSFAAQLDLTDPENALARRHRNGERALHDAGVPATFLRPAGFAYNVLHYSGVLGSRPGSEVLEPEDVPVPYPDVGHPVIDPADVARCAAAALLAGEASGPHLLTGPEQTTLRQQVAAIAAVEHRRLRCVETSHGAAAAQLRAQGIPEELAEAMLQLQGPQGVVEVTSAVEDLTGICPRRFVQWAQQHRGELTRYRKPS